MTDERIAALKGEDAARAKVLPAAARSAGCSVHLGIVHIEETGPAEPHYDSGFGYRGRGRWRHHDEHETEVCTTTRRTHQRPCEQHKADSTCMQELLKVMRPMPAPLAGLAARLAAAKERKASI